MEHTTTREIKWGIYEMVCIAFLKGRFFTSLIRRARIMGTGNPKMIFERLMVIVFFKVRTK
jgi:hypothetical protein